MRLTGMAKKGAELIGTEHSAYEAQRAHARWPRRPRRGYDLIEIFGGTSMITVRAVTLWGMQAIQPVDIRFGHDLRLRSQRRAALQILKDLKPRLAVVEWPCTPWSILQDNVNYRDDPVALEERREKDRPFLQFTNEVFRSQVSRGDHALGENPATARSWNEPAIVELRQRYYECTANMCMFDMYDYKNEKLLKKMVRWIATHPFFIEELNVLCDGSHEHTTVQGANTGHSAAYPPAVGDAVCRALSRVIDAED